MIGRNIILRGYHIISISTNFELKKQLVDISI
jgi:hypothetical protein